MARVLVVCPDLLFGSKLEGGLAAGGHQAIRVGEADAVRAALGAARDDDAGVEVLVVDLSAEEVDGAGLLASLHGEGDLGSVATLGFYPHVQPEIRARAEAAGFDLVVPRSRMAREMGALVDRLSSEAGASTAPGEATR